MENRFDYFVIFAEMRTGSNFLESNLNALDGVACYGEAFNPHFIGYPKSADVLGITMQAREAKPDAVIDAVRKADGMNGFRFFHNHDARVLDQILDDPRCAKIILTRNPAESYVSWKIAKSTGQWMLTDAKGRKSDKAVFNAEEFSDHVKALQDFQVMLLNRLQKSGQTAFYISYEDIRDVDVINGLAAFLGVGARLDRLDKRLKVQNPAALSEKVVNFDEMQNALSGVDRYNLTRTPNFEPRRSAAVPTYVAGADVPLIFMPIPGGSVAEIEHWIGSLQGGDDAAILRNMTQKALRKWKRQHGHHRSFTVLRHPLARAHHVFCTNILSVGPDSFPQLRNVLQKSYGVNLPDEGPDKSWTLKRHRAAFLTFLKFLKSNLAGQTSVRVDACWATQASIVQGFGNFILPDVVVRESEIEAELPALAAKVGRRDAISPNPAKADVPFDLQTVCNPDLQKQAADTYQRDYMMFGFSDWEPRA